MAAHQTPDKNEEPAQSFEKSLGELEEIVLQLEAGDKPLDESLALYERGVAALKRCHQVLDKAEKRIRTLIRGASGEPELREAELPGKPAANRRPPGTAPTAEKSDTNVSASAAGEVPTEESDTSEAEKLKKSTEPPVDSDAQPRQNVPTASNTKSRTGHGKPNAGGSLFGNS